MTDTTVAGNGTPPVHMDWRPFLLLAFRYNYGQVPNDAHVILNLGGTMAWLHRVSLATGDITFLSVDTKDYSYADTTLYDGATGYLRAKHKQEGSRKKANKIENFIRKQLDPWRNFVEHHGLFPSNQQTLDFEPVDGITVPDYIEKVRRHVRGMSVEIPPEATLSSRYGTEPTLRTETLKILWNPRSVSVMRAAKGSSSEMPVRVPLVVSRSIGGGLGVPADWVFDKLEENFAVLCDPLAWKKPQNVETEGKWTRLTIHTIPRPPRKKRSK